MWYYAPAHNYLVLIKSYDFFPAHSVLQDDDPDKVASLFDRARAAGAQQGSAADLEVPSGAFRGTSHTLAGGPQEVRDQIPQRLPWHG